MLNKEIHKKVLETVNRYSHAERTVNMYDKMADIGLDSLAFVKIIVSIEEFFDFEFDEEKMLLSAYENVEGLAFYVYNKVNNAHNK